MNGLKKCLFMHINFQCGGSKHTADIVEDLNRILLPDLN